MSLQEQDAKTNQLRRSKFNDTFFKYLSTYVKWKGGSLINYCGKSDRLDGKSFKKHRRRRGEKNIEEDLKNM